ncbi:peptide-N4-asparagine amidase [Luteimonas salinilitoris]|uniref:Peptide-N4-asparagine amidase n=1 Tax=Luteimonas salinilitoris TaxID=3237697 RepID=A0ABV4HM81_9GAMM
MSFPYVPPVGCSGPWAKVILKVAFYNADPHSYLDGITFAYISIDGVPLYSGGGQDNDVPTHWRVERDVTDYSAILRAAGTGVLEIKGSPRYLPRFNSPYYASATLLFYPANAENRARRVPDAVYPLTTAGWQDVRTPDERIDTSFTLPRNVERAYLDVMAHPRYRDDVIPYVNYGNDLFWFTCMPDGTMEAFPELTSRLAIGAKRLGLDGWEPPQGCRGGSFREVQVSIDGQPAGIAPVFPRVYPQFNAVWGSAPLFQPAPAPQVLNFMPYRVDLTPFAGLLSDGAPHTVTLAVASGGSIVDFHLSGTLLVYRDAGTAQIVGQVTRNTLSGQPPAPTVTSTLARNATGEVSGEVRTTSSRSYAIEGYIDTSRGRIRSTVERSVRFKNLLAPYAYDAPDDDADAYRLGVDLKSTVSGTSRRYLGDDLIAEDREYVSYPLMLAYRYLSADLQQAFVQRTERRRPGVTRYYTRLDHEVDLAYAPDYSGADARWQGYQHYLFRDSYSSCYRTDLATQDGMLTDYQQGIDCPGGVNRLYWASHPDGSPDGLGWAER